MKNGKCWVPTICFVFIIWDEERQMLAPDNLGFLFNYLRWRTVNAEPRQSVSNFTLYKIFSCWSTIVSFLDWIKWKTKQKISRCRNSSKNLITKFDTPYTYMTVLNFHMWLKCRPSQIETIYVHCWKIYNLFVRTLETGRIVILFPVLFRSKCKWIEYFSTIYVYCVYPVMLKNPKKMPNFFKKKKKKKKKKSRNKRHSHRF